MYMCLCSLYSVYSVYIGVYYVYRHITTHPNFSVVDASIANVNERGAARSQQGSCAGEFNCIQGTAWERLDSQASARGSLRRS